MYVNLRTHVDIMLLVLVEKKRRWYSTHRSTVSSVGNAECQNSSNYESVSGWIWVDHYIADATSP